MACVEHLNAANRSRALFATHFHELTAARRDSAATRQPHHAGQRVQGHAGRSCTRWSPGAADRSYGIQVAKLAGLPASVVKRARQVLAALEASRPGGALDSLPLFSYEPHEPPASDEMRAAVAALDPDAMSPREALEAIYALKRLMESKAK